MPCGCLFDMIDDILFDMNPFKMIVISESDFEITLVSKSRKSSERFSIRDDVGLSFQYDRTIFYTPTACSGCPLFDTKKQSVINLYQTSYSRLKRPLPDYLFDMTKDPLFEMTGMYDYRFQMTHGTREL